MWCLIIACTFIISAKCVIPPHIFLIFADDLGWYDISLHGQKEHWTENIDALGMNGITLQRHYVIDSYQPWSMPLTEKTLPELLKTKDYSTYLVGKGYDNLESDPSNWTYTTDLFTNKAVQLINQHNTSKPMFMVLSHLALYAASNPWQQVLEGVMAVLNSSGMTLADMISRLDYSVGQVVKALKERCMLDNSIILFISDNGAPKGGLFEDVGSNYPLRGYKGSPFEGAIRGAAVIFSPLLKQRQRISNQIIHVTDWPKTFARLAGVDTETVEPNLDGYDVWDALSNNLPSPRTEIVQHIGGASNYYAFISGQYKYITSTTNFAFNNDRGRELELYIANDTEYAEKIKNSEVGKALLKYAALSQTTYVCSSEGNQIALTNNKIISLRNQARVVCSKLLSVLTNNCFQAACLFDIIADPCEIDQLSYLNKAKFKEMQDRFEELRETAVPH